MVNEPKITNHSFGHFLKKIHNYKLLFFHVYPLHAPIYGYLGIIKFGEKLYLYL
jgi:hypothetical protein